MLIVSIHVVHFSLRDDVLTARATLVVMQLSWLSFIETPYAVPSMSRLHNLKRSARTRETMMLLPFCKRCSLHGMLSGRIVSIVIVVAVVGQFQEEMLERGALRSYLVNLGIGTDQRPHQFG